MAEKETGVSSDTKTIITVITLIFAYPIGVILMWIWMKWKTWIKLLLSLPFVLIILVFIVGVLAAVVNPSAQVAKSKCVASCKEQYPAIEGAKLNDCVTSCVSSGMKK